MTLYILEWDNEQEYDDNAVVLLGIYPSDDARTEAERRYDLLVGQWPFHDRKRGRYVRWDVELGKDLRRP